MIRIDHRGCETYEQPGPKQSLSSMQPPPPWLSPLLSLARLKLRARLKQTFEAQFLASNYCF
jgi:hypothetical protein